ncbi:MAG: Nucleoside triphosphate pyrophosphohydrolase [Chloroflexi bacterium]|nr:Nucleoside triphosphate pyrophosphohydrolase [Chloroflexota bacterium]
MLDRLIGEARQRFGLDPAAGWQIVSAERLVATPLEPSRPLLVVPLAVLDDGAAPIDTLTEGAEDPLPGRHGPAGRDPVTLIGRLYPADHPIGRFAGEGTTVGALTAEDLAGPLYFAPVAPELAVAGPWSMPYIAARLRLPDGCPWDREQTHESLRKHLLEEAYEVYDALEAGATPALAEELGDLLLQVVLHAQLAAEAGVFDLADVQGAIARKIIRRHPHVFGDAVAESSSDVMRQWERIKAAERTERDGGEGGGEADGDDDRPRTGALDGISRSMPALAASQEMQERAAALGYDWPSIDGVLEKVAEELRELAEAPDDMNRREEFGDLLLVIVNVGRRLGIETESALRAANEKFRRRFGRIERMVAEREVAIRDLDFATLDALWDAAKAEERAT